MRTYIVRRIILFIPALLMVSLIIFSLTRLLPGNIAEMKVSGGGSATNIDEGAVRKVEQQFGLDQPLWRQYATWVVGVSHLDFGDSMWTEKSINSELARRLPVTVEIAIFSIVVAALIAMPLGILSGLYQDSWFDQSLRIVAVLGISAPTFWTGTILLYFLLKFFNWSPPLGFNSIWSDYGEHLQQVVWPVLVLGFAASAVMSRMVRSSILEALRQDYMTTARAKGLSALVVVRRHALRNALIPVITLMGLQFSQLMGGTVILESLFGLPGMGSALVDAVEHRDYTVIQAVVVTFAVILMVCNLLIDITYAWIDPRIRYSA